MTIKITVPELGESIVEATVGDWHKAEGDAVAVGEVLVNLETDKVDIEVGAESSGVLVSIKRQTGEDVQIGEVLAEIDPDAAGQQSTQPGDDEVDEETAVSLQTDPEKPQAEPAAAASFGSSATPVAQRLADEHGIDLTLVDGSGVNGRITRQDVESYLAQQTAQAPQQLKQATVAAAPSPRLDSYVETSAGEQSQREERVRMSRRRRTIAQRLVEVQQTAAMLTTFNEIDMSAVIDLRQRRRDSFQKKFGVKLGFMSFFVKSVIGALKAFPRLNAEIDGDEMVIKHYYDIGMAVGVEEGLVVPVIREADRKSFAQIEQDIQTFAQKARDGALSLADLRGGTFTITNGGVYGSLLSTPILNPPQVGILGLHRIQERPIALNGEVVIRSMMYVALSYDHRIVDGSEAVQFLVRAKELIEEPELLLLAG